MRRTIIILIVIALFAGVAFFIISKLNGTDLTNIGGTITSGKCSTQGSGSGCVGGDIGSSCTISSAPGTCQSIGSEGSDGLLECACIKNSTSGSDDKKTLINNCNNSCTDVDGCICPTSCINPGNIDNGASCGGTGPTCAFAGGTCYSSLTICPTGTTSKSGICTGGGVCCAATSTSGGGGNGSDTGTGNDTGTGGNTGGGSSNGGGLVSGTIVQCGGSCTSDSDCAAPANGGTAVCRSGICENAACPAGKSLPGANCDCSSLNACGNPCSASLGLCQTGSSCVYVVGSSCSTSGGSLSSTTYCLPSTIYNGNPTGWLAPKCVSRDQGNNYATINGSNPILSQIQQACQAIIVEPAITTTCYRCTSALTDSNTCESFVVSGSSCPAGSTTTSDACATAAGGSCPTESTNNITCYACSDSIADGDACSPFTASGTSCPTGSSSSSTGCAAANGGSCLTSASGSLPNTAIINDRLDILIGILFIVLGITVYKYRKTHY